MKIIIEPRVHQAIDNFYDVTDIANITGFSSKLVFSSKKE